MTKPKLQGQVTTHLSDEDARAFTGLADMSGQTVSQYLRNLIEEHLADKRREYQLMHDIFSSPSSISSISSNSARREP